MLTLTVSSYLNNPIPHSNSCFKNGFNGFDFSITSSQLVSKKPQFESTLKTPIYRIPISSPSRRSNLFVLKSEKMVVTAVGTPAPAPAPEKRCAKGFVDEMRFVAMKLHTKDQAKEGEKETVGKPWPKWDPTIDGYLKFLVDSKVVYDILDKILDNAGFPEYAEFKNTGLERSENLAKDIKWFKEQGHSVPDPSSPGLKYSLYIEELSKNDPQAFICHFYNTYFAHTAGGRMIGKKVAQKILNGKELEFYKWDGDLSQLLQDVREKLNRVAEKWTREEKDHCLEETEKSFIFSSEILRLIFK